MPNWCANNLKITGHSNQISEIKKLMQGEVIPHYAKAIDASIKFFIAGMAKIALPIPNLIALPGDDGLKLTLADNIPVSCQKVEATSLNIAFSQWLSLLKSNPALTSEKSRQILKWYEESELSKLPFDSISEDQKKFMFKLFQTQAYDWFDCHGCEEEEVGKLWHQLDHREHSGITFDMRLILPPKLIPEMVGFNGHFLGNNFSSPLTAYSSYCEIYGVKWPRGYDVYLEELTRPPLTIHNTNSENQLISPEAFIQEISVDFDSPWGPPNSTVISELSRIYQCDVAHYYSEKGVNCCGYQKFSKGQCTAEFHGELERAKTDREDDDLEVIGPEFVLEHLVHYGC